MKRNLIVTAVLAVLMAGFVLAYTAIRPAGAPPAMGDMGSDSNASPVKGYAEGQEILFIHTEVSDPKIAGVLTKMMGSPVPVVPSLADVPDSMVANVYVFTNGIKDGGPLGFQPDVFDSQPGTGGYRPLRQLNLVTWKDGLQARTLKSAQEVRQAERAGEVRISRPGVVANMSMLTWPGGHG